MYEWDLNARQCVHKFSDQGGFNGTAIAVSPDSHYLATGFVQNILSTQAWGSTGSFLTIIFFV